MAQDNIILVNKEIQLSLLRSKQTIIVDFSDYQGIYEILRATNNKNLKIYDITHHPPSPSDTIIPINDHINRIGHNPFIGQQKFFNIDFINVEQIYANHQNGVTTTSYGNRYQQHKTHKAYPSTHIANIATIAHIQSYTIQGYLVNQTQ